MSSPRAPMKDDQAKGDPRRTPREFDVSAAGKKVVPIRPM